MAVWKYEFSYRTDLSLYSENNIYCRGKNMNTIERHLQLCSNKVQKSSLESGTKFSIAVFNFVENTNCTKTEELILDDCHINVVNRAKCLGVVIFLSSFNLSVSNQIFKVKLSKGPLFMKNSFKSQRGG